MLKWLVHRRESSKDITDDPLATISTKSKNNQVYSVNRINPLFEEKEENSDETKKSGTEVVVHSQSSGYESQSSNEGRTSIGLYVDEISNSRVPPPVWPKWMNEKSMAVYTSLTFDPKSRIHRKAQRPTCLSADSFSSSKRNFSSCSTYAKALAKNETASSFDGFSFRAKMEPSFDPNPKETPSIKSTYRLGSLKAKQHFSVSSMLRELDNHTYTLNSRNANIGLHFLNYPGLDFTLDRDQADILIKKLKMQKSQRCICRFVISIFSLLIFVLCVIGVSLLLTNGKSFFGSL